MGKKWITPLMKQAFVVLGVSLNMGNMGSIMGFTAILLPQLRAQGSTLRINDSSGSWIASIVGISLIIGNLIVPTLMGKFGRKPASLFSSLLILSCWVCIALATDVSHILLARFFHGFSLGINLSLSPIMVGELTSPVHRGLFSSIMTSSITAATLLVHIVGSYLSWQSTALMCAFITLTSFAILLFTPESPSWLADRGRFEDSRKAFRWLRGDSEDAELEKMIEAKRARDVHAELNKSEADSAIRNFFKMFKKKEFYKPVLIMIHLHSLAMWTGMCFLIVYIVDVIKIVVGNSVDVALQLSILDIQRMMSTICALYVVKVVKRRTILFTTLGFNVSSLVVIAGYSFAKSKGILPFDHPAIGLTLLHIHMCSLTTGVLPLSLVISGELFPLQFRSLAGGISAIAFSVNYFVTSKTAMHLLNLIGIHGAYCLYAAISFYCVIVVWIMLPETKDRTLHDIEEEFRGKLKSQSELDVMEPLNCKIKKQEAEEA